MTNNLGSFIKRTRAEKKLTQEQVAKTAGLARSYVSRSEDDQFVAPSAMVLTRLADGLGVSADSLFQEAGYLPHIDKSKLPSFDIYLRTKYPELSENAIEDLEHWKEAVSQKYKSNGKRRSKSK